MVQFFFDVVLDGRSEPAFDGVELESPERARAEAIALAAEVLRTCSQQCRTVEINVRDGQPSRLRPFACPSRFRIGLKRPFNNPLIASGLDPQVAASAARAAFLRAASVALLPASLAFEICLALARVSHRLLSSSTSSSVR